MALKLLVRRLPQLIPMMIAISAVVFALLAIAPIDPARQSLAGSGLVTDQRDVAARQRELGLDRPVWERYANWWSGALRGDLGQSWINRQPVVHMLLQRVPASATLALLALVLAVATGLPLGVFAALRAGTWVDTTIRVFSLTFASLPGFWLALLAIWLFAVVLRWTPALGSFTPAGIVLPALVLSARLVALLSRLMRATVLDELHKGYVQAARARGLYERTVIGRHVAQNALMPVLTVIGLDLATLFASAAIVEWVFAWPGVGRLGVEAALAGDLPLVMGFVVLVALVVVTINLLVDIGYGLVDPRQREPS